MHTLWLIRHGATLGGEVRRYIGRTDTTMSADGEAQMVRARDRLHGEPLDVVLCSDLRRSRRSAEILVEGRDVPIEVHPELREIDMGAWEGLAQAELAEREPGVWAARGADIACHRPPGGESFADLQLRLTPFILALSDRADRRRVAVAGHAGVNRVILATLLGMALGDVFRLSQDHGCISRVDWRTGAPVVRLLGMVPGVGGVRG